MLKDRLPKKYQKAVRDYYRDDDGYWLCLNDNYYLDDYYSFAIIHEDTQKEVLAVLRSCLCFAPLNSLTQASCHTS